MRRRRAGWTGRPFVIGCIATTPRGWRVCATGTVAARRNQGKGRVRAPLAGLRDRHGGGTPPLLTPEQQREVARWVSEGPDLARDGVTRWRRADLARAIERRFGVVMAERSVGDMLRRQGFRRLVPRPRHPGHDAAAQASFSATSPPS